MDFCSFQHNFLHRPAGSVSLRPAITLFQTLRNFQLSPFPCFPALLWHDLRRIMLKTQGT